jgi:hypothetical protein
MGSAQAGFFATTTAAFVAKLPPAETTRENVSDPSLPETTVGVLG